MCETVDELWIKPFSAALNVRKRRSEAISMHTGLCIELLLEFSHFKIMREFVGLLDQIVALL